MTPVSEAVRRGDLDWLSARLGASDYTPEVLALLLHHDDPRLRHLGLEHLGEHAELLPRTLDGPPETALLLARLYQRLRPDRSRPQWRAAELPASVRIAWLRAEIVNEPATVRGEPAGELLYQAVAGITAADAARPEDLVRELARSGDPMLRDAALRLVREALHGALLAPGRAREHVLGLLDRPAALRELAEPWAALTPVPGERLRPFLTSASVDDAIPVAARHGHADLLREVVADEARPPRSRQAALRALGDLAGREEIGAITAIANADPLLFGRAAVDCLRAMHRRGQLPGDGDAAGIVELALADHTIAAGAVATILFTGRHEAFRALIAADADDPGWPRRLALLIGLARQGGGDLAVGAAVTEVLVRASRPEPFLAAIRELRHQPAEAAVLDVLPRSPAAALDALEAIGGSPTVAALEEGLGPEAIAPHLRPVRHRALELLWHLTEDPDRRRAILARLDPRDVPPRIRTDLGGADRAELALLSAGADPDDPAGTLIRLARNGDSATVPIIADILLRIVAELAAPPEPGDDPAEPFVPGEVVAAVHALGARLHDRGKLRPFCLREAGRADEAGHALVATVALDLLDRPGLSSGEQAILLALLHDAPYPGTRARVHRLLRHRDRHVRKHVIALLAGDDAEALSASLIALTTAQDPQTVRPALLALGEIRARWAAPAIAAGLDHPVMNVKKTAAAALVRAGTPAVVPALLSWLGRHDNPGLRATLIEALQAILGHAYAATVLAAAEQAGDDRTRELLLDDLHRQLPARAVEALVEQGSPIAPILQRLTARRSVTASAPGTTTDSRDLDVDTLALDGWDSGAARRIVDRPEPPSAEQLARLRPLLADWLRLAGSDPHIRPAVLRLTLRICPAPWSPAEVESFARAAATLIDGLADDRDELFGVLDAVVPTMNAAQALDIASRIRALAPAPAGRRSPLALLRRCGAILSRTDVDHALASASLGPDPWPAESARLREAFAPGPDHDAEWRRMLESAVLTPYTIGNLRLRNDDTVSSRAKLNALIDVFPSAGPEARAAVLDWMESLQPIDAPRWTLAENAGPPAAPARIPHDGDLDQPRSKALRVRLLALLDAPEATRRDAAAAALRDWPEPDTRRAVLRAFLHGRADVALTPDLAAALTEVDENAVPERVARVASHLDPSGLERLIPQLLSWWEHGDPATRAAAGRALRKVPADHLADKLRERLAAGNWGFLDLLARRPLLRTPALDEISRQLRDPLLLVDGPLRSAGAAADDAASLAALRERPQPASGPDGPSRPELIDLIRNGQPGQIRRALTELAETGDPELEKLLAELLHHPESRVRVHAHRIGRRVLDRATYLDYTLVLLDDPEPGVIRSAVATVSHAGHRPAIPAVVGLLAHGRATVRQVAADGLVRFGPAAVPALTRAAAHARPDRRQRYTDVLERIDRA
ncbi:HEAT repeat domain-containing protein [Actinoplanes sp. HUAS TT8]|uniref:HEAT repeat domain-containing protein n=1 Tax=Actinoplanes sp. HUAS TT8 TaxID=3447453 RepID=UPI003F525CCA